MPPEVVKYLSASLVTPEWYNTSSAAYTGVNKDIFTWLGKYEEYVGEFYNETGMNFTLVDFVMNVG